MIEEYKLRVSKGYQMTAPAEFRKRFGIKAGDEIKLINLNGRLIMVTPPKNRPKLSDLIGKYRTKEKFDAVEEHDEL